MCHEANLACGGGGGLSLVQPRGVEILMGQTPVVVVSGAATGIGRRIAERFEEGGFRAAIGDANPAAVADFRASHPGSLASVVDVSDWRQVDAWFDEIEARFGRIDVLVNNAGIAGPTAPVEKIEPADWDRTIAVDLNGQFYCARRAVPLLRAAGGGESPHPGGGGRCVAGEALRSRAGSRGLPSFAHGQRAHVAGR
jgi:NAD(P)-dependent dehydrogenase (short-subunit alcohol dehydrogenase family)